MFEHRQEQMHEMLQSNQNFRRLYEQHQALDQRLAAASNGENPMDDVQMSSIKKQKLQAKDILTQLINQDN